MICFLLGEKWCLKSKILISVTQMVTRRCCQGSQGPWEDILPGCRSHFQRIVFLQEMQLTAHCNWTREGSTYNTKIKVWLRWIIITHTINTGAEISFDCWTIRGRKGAEAEVRCKPVQPGGDHGRYFNLSFAFLSNFPIYVIYKVQYKLILSEPNTGGPISNLWLFSKIGMSFWTDSTFKKIQPYQVKTVDNKLLVHAKHEESGGGLRPMKKILFMNNMTQENQSTVSTTGSFCFRQVKNHQEPTKNYNFLKTMWLQI